MPRYVYLVDLNDNGEQEAGTESVHGTAASAVHRLREYFDLPVPRGSIRKLKEGDVVWAQDPETEMLWGCAIKMRVW